MMIPSPLIVLFNYLTQVISDHYMYSIKQPNPLLFFLFIFPTLISFSSVAKQTDPFENITNIYSIIQDKKDFIWLSGQNGLYRFDGSQLINFSNNIKDWPIPFNWINSLSIKNEQLILATETKGLWQFDMRTGISKPINIRTESNTFYKAIHHGNSFYAITMAPQHLYRYDIGTGETVMLMKDIQSNALLTTKNRVYFNDKEELYYIDNTKKIKKSQDINKRITAIASTGDSIIIACKNNLLKLSDTDTIIKKQTPSPISAIAINNNSKNFFTVDLAGKIIKRDLETLKKYHHNFPAVKRLIYQGLLHDSSGVLWLLSNRGIQLITENSVKNHLALFDTKYSSNETEIYKDKLYIGSYGKGVYTLSSFNKKQINSVQSINENLSKKSLMINDLLSVYDELFIATFEGLWQYNEKNQNTKKVNLLLKNIDLSNLVLLKLVHINNLLYIATDGQGLIIYDLNKKAVIKHISKAMGLSSGEVTDILPLANGDIWLTTAVGVDVIKSNTGMIKKITNQTSAKFISLLQTDNKVFAASKGDGIFVYNHQGQLLAHFAKGINFNYLSLIDNHIFAAAKPGLYKISPENYQISMLTNTEKYSFTDTPLLYNNSILIANTLGVLELPQKTKAPFHPKVYISKTTVSGQSHLLNKTININSGNDVITLELASLDYRPGVIKQYSYTLDGNTWHQISGNQLTLTGLAAGNYQIEIMATNSLGQWSDYKAYTEISVAFPWYWTPQIRFVYAVVLLCLFFLCAWLFYLRSQSIRHIHSILQSDINNYGKTNMQVKRNLTVALNLLNKKNITQSKQLLQQCVDELSEQQKSPEPSSLNGNLLAVAIPFLAEYLQNKYQTNLHFQCDLNEEQLAYELRADLYKVVFEAVTCAILKGGGRNFKVVIKEFKDKIWLNISDDSQSFINFNSKINIDLSMYYIRQIANKHKGSINTFNEHDNGSQLVLSLPITANN